MINTKLLAEICEVAGAPGHEQRVREIVLREVKSLVDEIKIDNMGNVVAIKKGKENKKVMIEVPLKPETTNGHMQTRMARKLANGNYIVPHLLAFKIKEYRADGMVVNEFKTDLQELGGRQAENWPFTAIRLSNGNTVSNLTHGNKTVEFDKNGKVVWRVDNFNVEGRFACLLYTSDAADE